MTTDSISDFLTRIRNASHARRRDFTIPASRMLKSIAQILAAKHFIDSVDELPSEDNRKELRITLRTDREPLNLKRVSKPGQRIYVGFHEIKRIRNGLGAAIISTSHGLMIGEEAKQQKLGGEYICEVY